jgi:PAS domain S-box-containing protein
MHSSGTHDQALVTLSIVVAVFASYTALDLAGRVRAAKGPGRYAWLAAAAVAMGGGIWAMHFIAMLGYEVPSLAIDYDVGLLAASLAIAILLAGIAFAILRPQRLGMWRVIASGTMLALALVAMKFTGIAAMRGPMDLSYDPALIALAVVIAVGGCVAGLWAAMRWTLPFHKVGAAVILGLAISAMHFEVFGTAALTTSIDYEPQVLTGFGRTELALTVAAVTFSVLFLALIAALYDRRFALLAERESEALRESEARFRLLYRNTPLPLHSLDYEGVIEQVSEAWLKLLGYERHDVVGRPVTAFMPRDAAHRWMTVDSIALAEGRPLHDIEYQLEHRSGEAIDVLMSAAIEKSASGRTVRTLCGVVDITARKRAEEALRQAQKMEAVGQLTGGIAHDFNNLLTVVIGNLEAAQRAVQTGLFVKAQRNIDAALHGATRAVGVTQRLLAFSRPQPLRPKVIDLNEVVRGMSVLLRRTLGGSIAVKTVLAEDLWSVRTDANQVENALLNLAINSRDAMPGGGLLTVETANLPDGPERRIGEVLVPPGDHVAISVRDSGTGIPKEVMAQVFEPFFTTKQPGQGTGLGLAMVSGFAKQSGGTVAIESEIDKGTVVTILLPRVEEPPPTADQTSPARTPAHLAAERH